MWELESGRGRGLSGKQSSLRKQPQEGEEACNIDFTLLHFELSDIKLPLCTITFYRRKNLREIFKGL